jgi:hypothetical protein
MNIKADGFLWTHGASRVVRKIDALCQLRSMMRAICTARDRPEAFGAADARSLSRETRLGAYLSSGV